jgi:3-oxoacyl-[acyl-carrier protein] reductase
VASVIVTGAARGLGEAIARRLHAEGYRVALADIDTDGTGRVASELGDGARSFLHDIRELDSWEILLGDVRSAFGDDVWALVNNAARTEIRSFWEIDVAEWDDVLATNLRGTYLGCRVVGAYLRDRGEGRIVNLASVAGQASGAVTGVHYATSKAAIVALTRHAATALAPHGVTVNAVAPTFVRTPGTAERLDRPEFLADVVSRIPVGRVGTTAEVAAAVIFLASKEAAMVNGTSILVDGGWTAQ